MLLHFGAVDWKCTVWVNGEEVGEHTGGYDPFTFDITDALEEGENEIVVAVSDPTDTGNQPRGKQVLKPRGIMYTAVTGIWQTVWLETGAGEAYRVAARLFPTSTAAWSRSQQARQPTKARRCALKLRDGKRSRRSARRGRRGD